MCECVNVGMCECENVGMCECENVRMCECENMGMCECVNVHCLPAITTAKGFQRHLGIVRHFVSPHMESHALHAESKMYKHRDLFQMYKHRDLFLVRVCIITYIFASCIQAH
jgi:hypothetical protein